MKNGNWIKTINNAYGKIINKKPMDTLEICFISCNALRVFSLETETEETPIRDVETCRRTLSEFGFIRIVDKSGNEKFVEQKFHESMSLGKDGKVLNVFESEDEDYEFANDEVFTFAKPDNEVIKDFHRHVNDYDNWNPSSNAERALKRKINELEIRYKNDVDEVYFKKGKIQPDYTKPPLE